MLYKKSTPFHVPSGAKEEAFVTGISPMFNHTISQIRNNSMTWQLISQCFLFYSPFSNNVNPPQAKIVSFLGSQIHFYVNFDDFLTNKWVGPRSWVVLHIDGKGDPPICRVLLRCSISELREPIWIFFDVLESSNYLLFIFELFLKLESNSLDESVVFRAYVKIFWQFFVILGSRQPRTSSSVSKPLVMSPNLILGYNRQWSGFIYHDFPRFSIF